MVDPDCLNNGVQITLNLGDALLMFVAENGSSEDLEFSTFRSSSSIGLATWKSLPPHIRSNSENSLTRMADIPRA
jgi:hypothetical protein